MTAIVARNCITEAGCTAVRSSCEERLPPGQVGAKQVQRDGRVPEGDAGQRVQSGERTGDAREDAGRVVDIAVLGGDLLDAFVAEGVDDAVGLGVAEGEARVAEVPAALQLAADLALPGAFVGGE